MESEDKEHFLLDIYDSLEVVGSALEKGDFAIAQGALRAAFNGFGWFDYKAKPVIARRNLLSRLSDEVFKIREDLVNGVETNHIKLDKVVNENSIYQRLEASKNLLQKYVGWWYN